MQALRMSACAAGVAVCLAAIADDKMPADWAAWKASKIAGDIKIVKGIETGKWWNACRDWGNSLRAKGKTRRGEALQDFLLSEDMINGLDLTHARKREVEIGMTQCGLFAAIGMPNHTNDSRSASYKRSQLVYERPRRYIYTEAVATSRAQVITAIQD